MTAPIRLQLSRKRGFNLQALSQATNGLPAVNVARPTKWGNPYKVGEHEGGDRRCRPMSAADVVERYRKRQCRGGDFSAMVLRELRGKNLACWCKPGEPCHAEVLLELANRPICEKVAP